MRSRRWRRDGRQGRAGEVRVCRREDRQGTYCVFWAPCQLTASQRPRPPWPWAVPHLAVPASARPGLRRRCAQARLAGAPAEGARGGPGTGGGHAGGGIGGRALGCPSAPCPPSRSSSLRGESRRWPLRALSPQRTAPTCRVRGAPPPRTPILLPRKPPPPSYPRLGQAALGPRDRAPGSQLLTCRRPLRGPASAPGHPSARKVWG